MNNYIKFHATMTFKEGEPNPSSFAYQVVNLNRGWRELADRWYTHIDLMSAQGTSLAFVDMKDPDGMIIEGDLYRLTNMDVTDFFHQLLNSPGKVYEPVVREQGTETYKVVFNDHPYVRADATITVYLPEFVAHLA